MISPSKQRVLTNFEQTKGNKWINEIHINYKWHCTRDNSSERHMDSTQLTHNRVLLTWSTIIINNVSGNFLHPSIHRQTCLTIVKLICFFSDILQSSDFMIHVQHVNSKCQVNVALRNNSNVNNLIYFNAWVLNDKSAYA